MVTRVLRTFERVTWTVVGTVKKQGGRTGKNYPSPPTTALFPFDAVARFAKSPRSNDKSSRIFDRVSFKSFARKEFRFFEKKRNEKTRTRGWNTRRIFSPPPLTPFSPIDRNETFSRNSFGRKKKSVSRCNVVHECTDDGLWRERVTTTRFLLPFLPSLPLSFLR